MHSVWYIFRSISTGIKDIAPFITGIGVGFGLKKSILLTRETSNSLLFWQEERIRQSVIILRVQL